MNRNRWIEHLKESVAALGAGARVVPLGDNGELYHSLALQLAQMRATSAPGGPPRRPGVRSRGDPRRACH